MPGPNATADPNATSYTVALLESLWNAGNQGKPYSGAEISYWDLWGTTIASGTTLSYGAGRLSPAWDQWFLTTQQQLGTGQYPAIMSINDYYARIKPVDSTGISEYIQTDEWGNTVPQWSQVTPLLEWIAGNNGAVQLFGPIAGTPGAYANLTTVSSPTYPPTMTVGGINTAGTLPITSISGGGFSSSGSPAYGKGVLQVTGPNGTQMVPFTYGVGIDNSPGVDYITGMSGTGSVVTVTTQSPHCLTTGASVGFQGLSSPYNGLNGNDYTVTVTGEYTFTISATASGTFSGSLFNAVTGCPALFGVNIPYTYSWMNSSTAIVSGGSTGLASLRTSNTATSPLAFSATSYEETGLGTSSSYAAQLAVGANAALNAQLDQLVSLCNILAEFDIPIVLRMFAEPNVSTNWWSGSGLFPVLWQYSIAYITGNASIGYSGQPVSSTPIHNALFCWALADGDSSTGPAVGSAPPASLVDLASLDFYSAQESYIPAGTAAIQAVSGYSNIPCGLSELYGTYKSPAANAILLGTEGSATTCTATSGTALSSFVGTNFPVTSTTPFSSGGGQFILAAKSGSTNETALCSYTGISGSNLTDFQIYSGTSTWTVAASAAVTALNTAASDLSTLANATLVGMMEPLIGSANTFGSAAKVTVCTTKGCWEVTGVSISPGSASAQGAVVTFALGSSSVSGVASGSDLVIGSWVTQWQSGSATGSQLLSGIQTDNGESTTVPYCAFFIFYDDAVGQSPLYQSGASALLDPASGVVTLETGIGPITSASTTSTSVSIEGIAAVGPITSASVSGGYVETSGSYSGTGGAFTGTGSLSGEGTVVISASGSLTGTGSLSGSGVAVVNGSGGFSGTGALSGTGTVVLAGSGSLGATGSLSGTGTVVLAGTGSLTGSGALSGTAGALVLAGTGSFAGSAQLSGAGSTPGVLNGTGTLGGVGSLSGTGTVVLAGSGSLTGTASLSATGIPAIEAEGGSFTAQGSLTASGVPIVNGSGSFTAEGEMAGSGVWWPGGAGGFAAQGVLSGTGVIALDGSGSFTGSGSMAGEGTIAEMVTGIGYLVGEGQLNAQGELVLDGSGSLTGTSALIGSGVVQAADPRGTVDINYTPGGSTVLQGTEVTVSTGQYGFLSVRTGNSIDPSVVIFNITFGDQDPIPYQYGVSSEVFRVDVGSYFLAIDTTGITGVVTCEILGDPDGSTLYPVCEARAQTGFEVVAL